MKVTPLAGRRGLRDWFRGLRDPVRFAAQWHRLPPDLELVQDADQDAAARLRDQLDSRWKLLFDPQVLAWFWPFAREEPHGHPPFYALLGLAGDLLAPSWQDLPRARLGPILLFSLTAGAIFGFVSSRWGTWAAVSRGRFLGVTAESVRTRPLRGLRRHFDLALGPRRSSHSLRPSFRHDRSGHTTTDHTLGLGTDIRSCCSAAPPRPSSRAGSCRCRFWPGRAFIAAGRGSRRCLWAA